VAWGSVDVDDGMNGACFLLVCMDMERDARCVLDLYFLKGGVEIRSPVSLQAACGGRVDSR
jgi:hypothetical protein